jgi:beta-galactosidase
MKFTQNKSYCFTNFLLLLFILPCTQVKAQNVASIANSRTRISINNNWKFMIDSGKYKYADVKKVKKWATVSLPHTWNAADVMDDEKSYYRGTAWYKKVFSVDSTQKDKLLYLYFDGVNQQAEVYINGEKATAHSGGYTGFTVPVSKWLTFNKGKANVEIYIKADNRFNENIPPLTADFTFFGGIYRSIYLVTVNPVHFNMDDHAANGIQITTPNVSAAKAAVDIKSQLTNSAGKPTKVNLITKLYDHEGALVASEKSSATIAPGNTTTLTQHIKSIINPKLWSPDAPYLYSAITQITDAKTGDVIDQLSNPVGFRWFSFNAEKGFLLNGRPLKLMGTSRHQDYKNLGNALGDDLHVQDLMLLKKMGGNFLRISHYPQDPMVLEMCDKLGILTSVEIPIVNTITESAEFTGNCQYMLTEMIRQNFNHPSVIMWAYMNEVLLKPKFDKDKPRQEEYFKNVTALAKNLEQICRTEDPTRYTMMANHGAFELYQRTGLTAIPMIVGWNLYQGWYSDKLKGFGDFLDKHRAQLPDKPLMITEYGADADPRIHAANPVRFDKSIEYAVTYHQVYLDEIQKRPFVAGAAAWNLADFNSESREESMPHINNKGLLSWDRKPKNTYYLYQAALLKVPYLKIGCAYGQVRSGIAKPGDSSAVAQLQVFTNQKNVKLFVNGRDLGEKNTTFNTCTWDVPFVNGKNILKAVSIINGKMYTDQEIIDYDLQPFNLKDKSLPFSSINILLGSSRNFVDEITQQIWLPDQAYRNGSWGYIGGTPYKVSNGRQAYGAEKAIAGTENDPIYQTQQTGIEQYRLDVPNGEYEISMYFAELDGGNAKEAIPYDLGQASEAATYKERVFDVYINDQLILKDMNIARQYGYARAVNKKMRLTALDNKGIQIMFKAKKGLPVMNALQVKRIY